MSRIQPANFQDEGRGKSSASSRREEIKRKMKDNPHYITNYLEAATAKLLESNPDPLNAHREGKKEKP